MNVFQILFVPLCMGMSLVVLLRTLRHHISRRQGIVWTLLWLTGAMFIAAPNTSIVLAGWLGIGRGSDLISYLAIIAGLAALLHFHNRYRTLEILITELVRRDAIQHAQCGGERSDVNNALRAREHDSL